MIETILYVSIIASHFVIAKLSSVKFSASQVELRLALLSQNTHPTPPHPDKYIWASSRLPLVLKFGMEALLNQSRSTS